MSGEGLGDLESGQFGEGVSVSLSVCLLYSEALVSLRVCRDCEFDSVGDDVELVLLVSFFSRERTRNAAWLHLRLPFYALSMNSQCLGDL